MTTSPLDPIELPTLGLPLKPGARWTFTHNAPPNTIYTADAFDTTIGAVIPIKLDGTTLAQARIIKAAIVGGSTAVDITVELL